MNPYRATLVGADGQRSPGSPPGPNHSELEGVHVLLRVVPAAGAGGFVVGGKAEVDPCQGCQIAIFDPFLSLDCARVEGAGGGHSKERKGSNVAA